MATNKLGRPLLSSFVCDTCQHRLSRHILRRQPRLFSTSTTRRAEDDAAPPPAAPKNTLRGLDEIFAKSMAQPQPQRTSQRSPPVSSASSKFIRALDGLGSASLLDQSKPFQRIEPHRLHIYATKHNTHVTFVQAARPASETASSSISTTSRSASSQNKTVDTLLSLSTGNIGFRKAQRGSFDAAYQLTAFALKTMKEKAMLQNCDDVEIVFRGFGEGREAAKKVLLGIEGRDIRPRIRAVMDATRLKQGGPRSPKPRRLG